MQKEFQRQLIAIYKGISANFHIPIEILLCATASAPLTTPRLLSRGAYIGRLNHLSILFENDESDDLSCPLDIDAAANDLPLRFSLSLTHPLLTVITLLSYS